MQAKIFKQYQIILFIHHCDAFKDEKEVQLITEELGFSYNVYINGSKAMPLKNLYAGYFEGDNSDTLLFELKEKIYNSCKKNNFGVLDFFLIDATNSAMFKAMWHDGFY